MKSLIITIGSLVVVGVAVIGLSQAGAFTTTSFYPGGAPATADNVLRIMQTAQAKLGALGIGRTDVDLPDPAAKLDVLGGVMTTGASIAGTTEIAGRLRVGPVSNPTSINNTTTASVPSDVVSVEAGQIIYDTKKPTTTRALCTHVNGIIAPCGDVENQIISGAEYSLIDIRNKTVNVPQGNQAAMHGLFTGTVNSGCGYNVSWGSTSPFPLSVTAKTSC
jgi:hypothetical protein